MNPVVMLGKDYQFYVVAIKILFRIMSANYFNLLKVSAANGAEEFYSVEEHAARFEGIELARERDKGAMESWREHPYVDIVDNRKSSDFDGKARYIS